MSDTELPPIIPRDVLFGNPQRTSPSLSPDGRHAAFLAPLDGVLNVWVGRADQPVERFEALTRDSDRGVRIYFWAQDSSTILYLQDVAGNENWRIYGVDITTRSTRDLTPFEGVQARVIASHKDHPDEILIGLNKDDPKLHDAFRLTLSTGKVERVARNPGNVVGWMADANFLLRGATAFLADGSSQFLVRDSGDGESWRLAKAWTADDALSSRVVGFTPAGDSVYAIDADGSNAARLTLLGLETGEVETIAEDPIYDVSGVILHPDTRELQAAAILKDKIDWCFFDDAFEADFRRLRDVDVGEISIAGRDRNDALWLVGYSGDTKTSRYHLYNRQTRQAELLFASQPDLDRFVLAQMLPIEIPSRDGLTLHGYLSLPVGPLPKNLPMVLDVHGGPWSRDRWGLDTTAQWLCNRGYASLQINFRGSTGYGKSFLNAGNREWGGKMHDDLVDAVGWAIDEGIADPARVAIFGGSYGGYAALAGATFTPDLFCCAVDIVGPSNLITLLQSFPPYWETMRAQFYRRVGDPVADAEFLKSRSPLTYVDRIRIPILIGQGANDPRVKQAESDQIVDAMRAKQIPCEYLVFEDEGHGFAKPENRLRFYAAAEQFLAKHLGGRAEP